MADELTSTRAPQVAAARRLLKRAYRVADRRFLAEGPQAVREALGFPAAGGASPTPDPGGHVVEVFVTADAAARHAELVAWARAAQIPVHRASGEVLGSITQAVTPQGMVAVCRFLDVTLGDVLAAHPRLLVLLAAVRDPGNAGTVIRTADAAGADAVILTDASVDLYNGKCVRASAGSVFHLPLVTGVPTAHAVEALRTAGMRILAADGTGSQDLDLLLDGDLLGARTAWLFGNEAWGLPDQVRNLADQVVRVPIHGRAESLNLAAAAAVCLYASARSQRSKRGQRRPAPEPAPERAGQLSR